MSAAADRSPLPADAAAMPRTTDLLVVGAGVMGAWTALRARRGGREVTLLDAWGSGHSRASSGDETRIIRSGHGPDRMLTTWARRSREDWIEAGEAWGLRLLAQNGVLWFAREAGGFEDQSAVVFDELSIPHERLDADEIARRWPRIAAGGGMRFGLWEPEAGTLMARSGCQAVVSALQEAGGRYALAGVRVGRVDGHRLVDVVDEAGRSWSAESYVFACGPWLPQVFPDILRSLIRVTKQDVMYFGPLAGDARLDGDAWPTWVDYHAAYYGTPAFDVRGFKVVPDAFGRVFDPTHGERMVDPESIRLARAYLRLRFPELSGAPVVETRVCQYETTPDGQFILDRHPELENVWIAGGGSGHGFKHGPMIGRYVLARMDGATDLDAGGDGTARFTIGPRTGRNTARTGGDTIAESWELF